MRTPSKLLLAAAAAAATLALLPVAAGADSDGGGDGPLLRSGLVGSTPTAQGGPTLFGVAPGGAPWVVDEGTVRLGRDGRLDVKVEGLVIPTPPPNGTNPLPGFSASVVCNGVDGALTAVAPLSTAGDGRIRATVSLPSPCLAPAVLVHPNGVAGAYIAATG
jgi:hypothetical protein